MTTLDELQTEIDAIKSFIGVDGFQAGQRRIRENYLINLQNEVADAKLIMADKSLDDEARQAIVERKLALIKSIKARIDALDKQLGPGENGNRAARRRAKA